MGTVKPKLQGYVKEDLYVQFELERNALGLSQSQALEKILLERYGGSSDVSISPNRESLYWITKSLEDLQERVKKLEITGNLESDSLGNLESNLESDSLGNLESNLESDSPSNLESDSLGNLESNLESDSLGNLESNLESESPSNLESESPSNLPTKATLAKGLGQRALAKRLGCSYKILGDFVILGSITAWSQRQDPDGLAWELKDKKFYPCSL